MVEEAYPRFDVDLLLNSRTWGGIEIEGDLDARLVRLTRHRGSTRRIGHIRHEKRLRVTKGLSLFGLETVVLQQDKGPKLP